MPASLVAAGCSDTVSLDPVAKAAEASTSQTSEHMTLFATVTAGLQTITMTGSGDFQNDPMRGDLDLSAGDGSQTVSIREILEGTTVYLTSNALGGVLPGGKTWMKFDVAKTMKSLGVDLGAVSSQTPADAFARLQASGAVTKVGPATVGGVAVTRYSVLLDPAKVAKLTKGLLQTTVSYAPVDVWVDGKGLVRRMHIAAVYGDSATTVPQSTVDMTMTLSDYGEHVSVAPPPDAVTYDAGAVLDGLLRK